MRLRNLMLAAIEAALAVTMAGGPVNVHNADFRAGALRGQLSR